MILTELEIKKAIDEGLITIHDGEEIKDSNCKTIKDQSVDVRLGRWLYIYDIFKNNEYWVDLDIHPEWFKVNLYTHFIIAHTEEFIGTTAGSGILPTFKLKSSAGRLGIIHTLAGHWEVGYNNRWAMEFITAKPITLKRYMSIGQIYFTETVSGGWDYSSRGTYQSTYNLEEMVKNWTKESILPPKELKVLTNI